MTDNSDFENKEIGLLNQFHGALSLNNDIFSISHMEREYVNTKIPFSFLVLPIFKKSPTPISTIGIWIKNLVVVQNEMTNKMSKIDTLAGNVGMNLLGATEESNRGKTPKETSCTYDNPETRTAGPNRFLDEIPPKIPDLLSDPNSEKLVDIPKNVIEKSLFDEKLGKIQPVRPGWTNIKSKCATPLDEKRVLEMLYPTFEISGTSIEEIPHSTDNSSEEVEKPKRLQDVEIHERMVVEKIFLENTHSGMFPESYHEYQEKRRAYAMVKCCMESCGKENFECAIQQSDKISFFTCESDGTIGAPKRLVDRPSKPKLGFYLNDFVPKLHYGHKS